MANSQILHQSDAALRRVSTLMGDCILNATLQRDKVWKEQEKASKQARKTDESKNRGKNARKKAGRKTERTKGERKGKESKKGRTTGQKACLYAWQARFSKTQQKACLQQNNMWLEHLFPAATDRILASGLKATALTGPLCSLALNTTVSPAAAVSTTLTTPNSDPKATRLLCKLLARHLVLTHTL